MKFFKSKLDKEIVVIVQAFVHPDGSIFPEITLTKREAKKLKKLLLKEFIDKLAVTNLGVEVASLRYLWSLHGYDVRKFYTLLYTSKGG